jgi:ArsR family transcriptional regulator
MEKPETVERMAQVFKALGDATRLRLIALLAQRNEESFCVLDLAGKLGMTQPAVSQHLKILRGIGLVRPNRKGFRVYYTIDLSAMNSIKDDFMYLYDLAFERCADEGWLKNGCE